MKIRLTVKPNSHKAEVIFVREGQYRVAVTPPPSQNKANEAVIEVLAEYFHLPKSLITIVRGHHTRAKTIEIQTDQKLI